MTSAPAGAAEGDARLHAFCTQVVPLLAQHAETASLADRLRELDLPGQLARSDFFVAVVGLMKAGKSTLLNALVEQALAPVGVDITTATVNVFMHGETGPGSDAGCLIHWRDPARAPEARTLREFDSLLGDSREAEAVDHVVFRSAAGFLRGVTLLDTPGAESSSAIHEAALQRFVARDGSARADAVVLALPTEVGRAEQSLLLAFAAQTRLPGQSPYNTVAVLQKWESLEVESPEAEARTLAKTFRRSLDGQVSEVIPVSGLLWTLATRLPDEAFDALVRFARDTPPAVAHSLLRTEERFRSARADGALDPQERAALLDAARVHLLGPSAIRAAGTFEMLRYAIGLASRRKIGSGTLLRAALRAVSGIDELKAVLKQRFFARTALIRAGSVLRKGIECSDIAIQTLRQSLRVLQQAIADGDAVLQQLISPASAEQLSPATVAFARSALPLLKSEEARIRRTLRHLDDLTAGADEELQWLARDFECRDLLLSGTHLIPADLIDAADALCGQRGMSTASRLGMDAQDDRRSMGERAKTLRQALAAVELPEAAARHLADRLDRLLDALNQT
ncbi:MAG: dynamin family protein [Rubrivivax sp.]